MRPEEFHFHQARAVKKLIETCNRCELGKGAHRVPYSGNTWKPTLILLGEAPGQREDVLREPFVGPAGLLLDKMLASIGLSRNEVMIANTICCRPPGNRDPEWAEIEACGLNRRAQIGLGRTWVGVSLGRIALGTLLEDPGKSIGAFKGKPFWKGEMVWVPTYHPAYALRNKSAIVEIASHIKLAQDIHDGRKEAPKPPTDRYVLIRGNLVVDHDRVKVPERVRELAEAIWTKEEWMRVTHSPEGLQVATKMVKSQFRESTVIA